MTPDYNWWDKIILLLSETWKPGTFNQIYLTYYMVAINWSKCVCSVPQTCPTLCDPMDCGPPDSSVPGIFQAWILSGLPCPPPGDLPRDRTASPGSLASAGGFFATSVTCFIPLAMDFPGKNTGVGCHYLLEGIFLTQGPNLHLCKTEVKNEQVGFLFSLYFLNFIFKIYFIQG